MEISLKNTLERFQEIYKKNLESFRSTEREAPYLNEVPLRKKWGQLVEGSDDYFGEEIKIEELNRRGYNGHLALIRRGSIGILHKHRSEAEFIFVLDGELFDAVKRVWIKRGEGFFIEPEQAHEIESPLNNTLCLVLWTPQISNPNEKEPIL